ncbi:MAG: hypothetical protein LBT24_05480, partial [Tannerella sp.]|nr:hypothetical protein [Tannerella sp.]
FASSQGRGARCRHYKCNVVIIRAHPAARVKKRYDELLQNAIYQLIKFLVIVRSRPAARVKKRCDELLQNTIYQLIKFLVIVSLRSNPDALYHWIASQARKDVVHDVVIVN